MADESKPMDAETAVEIEADAEEIKTSPAADIASQMMKNPLALAAVQDRLTSLAGHSSGYIESLPAVVKRRIKALKKLQLEATKIEGEFYEEVHRLECKYADRYACIHEKRKNIVNGVVEPTDSDSEWPSDDEDEEKDEEEKLANDLKSKAIMEDDTTNSEQSNTTGIPQFWLTIFKNVEMLNEMVQDHDAPILTHLHDITVVFSEKDPMAFTLHFYFENNDYFTNEVLTKQYIMRSSPDPEDPLGYEGPEIISCKGCTIDWKKDKNVTVKIVKKKQKHKGRGTTRTVTKSVQTDSFFNFFNPPAAPDEDTEDDETDALLAADYEIGHFIRERIVPRAVLYFTGEIIDDDDDEDSEFEDEEGEGEDGEEGEEEDDPDYDPTKDKKAQECKQQ